MPREMTLLRVVVVSPSDVKPERDSLQQILDSLNRDSAHESGFHLELARWETDAYPGFHPEGPQGIIDSVLKLDDADIVIGIFWTRFGTSIVSGQTGTEHELKAAIQSWRIKKRPQVMVYFNCAPYSPKGPDEIEQWGRVLEFKKDFPKEGFWCPYEGKKDFTKLVERHLRRIIPTLAAPVLAATSKSAVAPPAVEPPAHIQPPVPKELGKRSPGINPDWKYALALLGVLVVAVAIYIFFKIYTRPKVQSSSEAHVPSETHTLSNKKAPLILMGSSNVNSYLDAHVSRSLLAEIGPIWFDLPSEDTQTTAYGAFANGVSNRQDLGFIAMSSDGSTKLEKLLASVKSDENTDGKMFLSIVVARRPLTVFYRISSDDVLRVLDVRKTNHLPEELSGKSLSQPYHFVQLKNLRPILDKPYLASKNGVMPFLTEGASGTKRLFQEAARTQGWEITDWSRFKGVHPVPQNLEGFQNSSFIEILSEPQRSQDSSETCSSLVKRHIQAAVICTGAKSSAACPHVKQAEYVLIFKLQPTHDLGYSQFKIPNPMECSVARELNQRFLESNKSARNYLTADCRLELDTPLHGRIYTIDLADEGLPKYLTCE